MAGAMNTFVYKDDNATLYLVTIDNSNGQIANSGFTVATQAQIDTLPALPKTLKMRYVNCFEPDTGTKRRLYIGALTSTIWTHAVTQVNLRLWGGDIPGAEVPFSISSRIGEKQRYLFAG